MKFRKKPVVIEAIRWEGGDYECLNDFCGHNWGRADAKDVPGPDDKEGVVVWNIKEKQWLNLPLGHWLIRGIGGELYPCAPDIFAATYDPSAPAPADDYLQQRGRDITLECSAHRLLLAIQKLGDSTAEKITYFEASPSKDAECQKRWQALNDAGKFLRELLAHRKSTESRSAPAPAEPAGGSV